jgi:hypothetical protein
MGEERMSYDVFLYSTLYLAYVAATCQFLASFIPKFSPVSLVNALLLSTAYLPLAIAWCGSFLQFGAWLSIDSYSLGCRAGIGLCLANYTCSLALGGEWVRTERKEGGVPAIFSTLGLVAFCIHVFIFAACP